MKKVIGCCALLMLSGLWSTIDASTNLYDNGGPNQVCHFSKAFPQGLLKSIPPPRGPVVFRVYGISVTWASPFSRGRPGTRGPERLQE